MIRRFRRTTPLTGPPLPELRETATTLAQRCAALQASMEQCRRTWDDLAAQIRQGAPSERPALREEQQDLGPRYRALEQEWKDAARAQTKAAVQIRAIEQALVTHRWNLNLSPAARANVPVADYARACDRARQYLAYHKEPIND